MLSSIRSLKRYSGDTPKKSAMAFRVLAQGTAPDFHLLMVPIVSDIPGKLSPRIDISKPRFLQRFWILSYIVIIVLLKKKETFLNKFLKTS